MFESFILYSLNTATVPWRYNRMLDRNRYVPFAKFHKTAVPYRNHSVPLAEHRNVSRVHSVPQQLRTINRISYTDIPIPQPLSTATIPYH